MIYNAGRKVLRKNADGFLEGIGYEFFVGLVIGMALGMVFVVFFADVRI